MGEDLHASIPDPSGEDAYPLASYSYILVSEDMKDAPEVVVPEAFRGNAEFSQTCPPEVQDLYTRIWTDLRK